MLLVASETGHVYTFATEKLQPMITSEAGKNLIQSCLSYNQDDENCASGGDNKISIESFNNEDVEDDFDDDYDEDDDDDVDYADAMHELNDESDARVEDDSNEPSDNIDTPEFRVKSLYYNSTFQHLSYHKINL